MNIRVILFLLVTSQFSFAGDPGSPTMPACYKLGDQQGYLQALKDFQVLTGHPAGCTRLVTNRPKPICKNLGPDYQLAYNTAYTQTLRDNIRGLETNVCSKSHGPDTVSGEFELQ